MRKPTTPGEVLYHEFLVPLRLSQRQLADHIGNDVKGINRIVNGRAAVTADMAVKLGAVFGTTAEFWLNLQRNVDLHVARGSKKRLPGRLVAPVWVVA